MNNHNGPTIQAIDLVKSYSADIPKAVDGISFEVPPGSVFGLLGPNGAGKTTLVKMLLGLVIPSAGRGCLAGYDVARDRRRALSQAGAVLEGARNIYWRLSARANLEYFGALHGLNGRTLTRRITEVLELVNLTDRADEETRQLSRGMQQKVALAVAILHEPQALLLDEPTLGLDVQAARTIEQTIHHLTAEQGKAVLLTTHQMDLAQRLCDWIFVIDRGQRIVQGPTQAVIQRFGQDRPVVEIRLGSSLEETAVESLRAEFPVLGLIYDLEGRVINFSESPSQQVLLTILQRLDSLNVSIVQVGRREPTLEEVFLHLTGHPERGK
jgi:ABC-2 type transport system ATP-binding protein